MIFKKKKKNIFDLYSIKAKTLYLIFNLSWSVCCDENILEAMRINETYIWKLKRHIRWFTLTYCISKVQSRVIGLKVSIQIKGEQAASLKCVCFIFISINVFFSTVILPLQKLQKCVGKERCFHPKTNCYAMRRMWNVQIFSCSLQTTMSFDARSQ